MYNRRQWTNWPGNLHSAPRVVLSPGSTDELAELLAAGRPLPLPVHAVGSARSDSPVAAPDEGTLVSLDRMNRLIDVDTAARTVTVEGGMTVGGLNHALLSHGLAIASVPATSAPTVAGAISTGTHGSGVRHGSLSGLVRALTLVAADGSVRRCADAGEVPLDAVRVGLGAMGIVTSVTLACEPSGPLWARESRSALSHVLPRLDAIARSSEHTTLAWLPVGGEVVVRTISRTEPPPGHVLSSRASRLSRRLGDRLYGYLAGATAYTSHGFTGLHRTLDPLTVTPALDMVGESHKILCPDGFVRRLAVEYALPREHATAALAELGNRIQRHGINIHCPVTVRFGAAETGWLAPAHGRETCYVNLTVHRPYGRTTRPVSQFREVENVLRAYDARPMWAKNHGYTTEQLADTYPRWSDFQAVRRKLDPDGRFLNRYLRRLFSEP